MREELPPRSLPAQGLLNHVIMSGLGAGAWRLGWGKTHEWGPVYQLLISPSDPETCKCPLSNPSEKPGEIPVPPKETGKPPETARQARQIVSSISSTLVGLSWLWEQSCVLGLTLEPSSDIQAAGPHSGDLSYGEGPTMHITSITLTR